MGLRVSIETVGSPVLNTPAAADRNHTEISAVECRAAKEKVVGG